MNEGKLLNIISGHTSLSLIIFSCLAKALQFYESADKTLKSPLNPTPTVPAFGICTFSSILITFSSDLIVISSYL